MLIKRAAKNKTNHTKADMLEIAQAREDWKDLKTESMPKQNMKD